MGASCATRRLGWSPCLDLVARARAAHPLAYELLANELQDAIEPERTSHHAAALGSIDTFRFEEAIIRADTLSKLAAGEWEVATVFAAKRTPEECFWVRRSEPLQRTWELMRLAAKAGLGMVSTRQARDRCNSLEEAVERYVTKLARVDRDHRVFEQRARTAIVSELEDYDRLLAVRDAVCATLSSVEIIGASHPRRRAPLPLSPGTSRPCVPLRPWARGRGAPRRRAGARCI